MKYKVRHVKFTPEEMAIDAADVDMSKCIVIARGQKEWEEFLSFKRGYVRLDPELRGAFPDDKSVNEALRKVMELSRIPVSSSRRKKSA